MPDNIDSEFLNGYWIWNDVYNSLEFISRDIKENTSGAPTLGPQPPKKDTMGILRFKDAIDGLGMAQFRRQYQRRIKPNEPQIVTIQDVKDVAIFTAEKRDLTVEFLQFLHTRKMDKFLRTLIVYFQFYLQTWDNLMVRREEAKRKLRQPLVTVLENTVRDALSDLRSMVARNYAYVLLGLGDTFKYYHMGNRNHVSLSDKDRHLHECLLSIATKIVWIALLRKNFTLIEIELNRIFRSKIFNVVERLRQSSTFETNPNEDRVLLGKVCLNEKKLKHRSPAIQELIFDNHDYEMLAIGELRVEPVNARIAYLEAAYTAPEELLLKLKIGVGILGLDKGYLNPILQPKEGMAKRIFIPPFKIPQTENIKMNIAEILPKNPVLYSETEQTKLARKCQSQTWRKYVAGLTRSEDIASSIVE